MYGIIKSATKQPETKNKVIKEMFGITDSHKQVCFKSDSMKYSSRHRMAS